MNDTTKTVTFVAIAAAVLLVAWASRPKLPGSAPNELVGQRLFADFNDPKSAASLDIVEYDETTGTLRPFQVARVNNIWSLPSHNNYPADAKDQMAQAARDVMDLKILQVVSDTQADHAEYGVVDPDPKTLQAGTTGVGTRVVMKDSAGKQLLGIVIGKPVKGRTDQRYIRKIGQDNVYVVNIKTNKLTPKFEDWIEKNLLKLDSFDFQAAQIDDYSVDIVRGQINQRGQMTVAYNDAGEPKWKLTDAKASKGGKEVEFKLAADEELNATKLDDMKRALDDLKIVDVNRKPKGLSGDLKASADFAKNSEAVESLAQRGFYVAKVKDQVSVFSNEGEIRVQMKTGVEYILRFGNIAAGSGSAKKDDKKDELKDGKKPDSSSGLNRYILVTAQFNAALLPKPKLDPLPEAKPAAKADEKKADEKKDGAKKDDQKADEKAKPAEKKEPVKDEAELKAEREQIEKENKRKQDEYDAKVKAGQEKAKELNTRFADWYYVISDDVYKKIHLTRADIIKKKDADKDKKDKDDHAGHDHGDPAKGAGVTPSDFDKLKESVPGGKPE